MRYTTLQLMLDSRDARIGKGAELALLLALAMRCDPKRQVCWPSYALLSRDTGLDEQTLKRAARKLETATIVARQQRTNTSNRFFLNFALLRERAEANRAADKADRERMQGGLPAGFALEAGEDHEDEGTVVNSDRDELGEEF